MTENHWEQDLWDSCTLLQLEAPEIVIVGQLIIWKKNSKLTEAQGASKDINGWSTTSVAENTTQWERSNQHT